jgi:hypothetical protein
MREGRQAMLTLHLTFLDVSISRDLWLLLAGGISAVLLATVKGRRR